MATTRLSMTVAASTKRPVTFTVDQKSHPDSLFASRHEHNRLTYIFDAHTSVLRRDCAGDRQFQNQTSLARRRFTERFYCHLIQF